MHVLLPKCPFQVVSKYQVNSTRQLGLLILMSSWLYKAKIHVRGTDHLVGRTNNHTHAPMTGQPEVLRACNTMKCHVVDTQRAPQTGFAGQQDQAYLPVSF